MWCQDYKTAEIFISQLKMKSRPLSIYIIRYKYSSALNNYTIQAANKKDAGQTVQMRRLICTFVVRTL